MPDELSFEVPRHEHGPALARAEVRDAFTGRMQQGQLEDLLVVVSELTTNALLYGRGAIGLEVQVDGGVVRGEVSDEGSGFERQVGERGVDTVGGNGLRMVGALAGRWGIHEGSSHVWFEVAPGDEREPVEPRPGPERRPHALDD